MRSSVPPKECQDCIVRCGSIQEGSRMGEPYCPYHKQSCHQWFESHDECDGHKSMRFEHSETPKYKPMDASLDRFMEGME